MGRTSIVLMAMVLWVVFVFCWERQTSLSIWWHGGSVDGAAWEEDSRAEILEEFFNWTEPVWSWLPDGRACLDWVPVSDSDIEYVDLGDADISHKWLPRLRRCRNVSGLELKSSQLGPEIASLSDLPHLRRVLLRCDEELVNVRDLGSLTQFTVLQISAGKSRVLGLEAFRQQRFDMVDFCVGDADEVIDLLATWSQIGVLWLHSDSGFSTRCCERIGAMRNLRSVSFQHGSFPEIAGLHQILRNDSLKDISISGPDRAWIDEAIGDTELKQQLEQHLSLERLSIVEDRFDCASGFHTPESPFPKMEVYGYRPLVKNGPPSNDD